MNQEMEILYSMINWTSIDELNKWNYELLDTLDQITLCDVRRKIEKTTNKKFTTEQILLFIKKSWWIITSRQKDNRYDIVFVDIEKMINLINENNEF